MNNLLLLIIYLLGVVCSYLVTRKFVRIWAEENNEDYTYSFVIFIFLISTIFSWASFIVIGTCLIIALLSDKEPPNWL